MSDGDWAFRRAVARAHNDGVNVMLDAIVGGKTAEEAAGAGHKTALDGLFRILTAEEASMLEQREPTRWERFEAWLFDDWLEGPRAHRGFTNLDVAAGMHLAPAEASRMIAAYLDAQRGKNSNTLYVLKRTGRTSTAVWSVGHRTADARVIGDTLFKDVRVKVLRAFRPDLERLEAKNPRAARYAEAKIAAVMDGALQVLAAAVDTYMDDDEE